VFPEYRLFYRKSPAGFAFLASLFVYCASPASASTILGTAQDFAVLAHESVTNTGTTSIYGNVGVSPGTSITGAPTLIPGSVIHNNDSVAGQALTDEIAAYNSLKSMAVTGALGAELGGTTLTQGVYHFSDSAQITGTLTLDVQGLTNALFVFQIPSTLTTASSSVVNVINGLNTGNQNIGIYWEVGSSATLGTGSAFSGNILALASVTLNTSAEIVCGRAFAQTGSITMDTNVISEDCNTYSESSGVARSDYGSLGFSGNGIAVAQTPEPGTMSLFGGVFVLGAAFWSNQGFRKSRRAV
jgi:hypothetical protein